MVLKPNLVRDLLIYFEKELNYKNNIIVNNIVLKKYKSDDIIYTCEKLYEAKLINAKKETYIISDEPTINVFSLTFNGHEFLDNIRNNIVWKEIKTVLKKVGIISLDIMIQIATNIISSKLGS